MDYLDYLESEIKAPTIKTDEDARMRRNGKCKQTKKKKKYKGKGKVCYHCNVVTTEMKRHLVKHNKIKPFKCDHCEKAFGLKFNLKRHIDLHHNPEVELFSCSKCAQRLTTKRTFLMHEVRHSEKPKSDMKMKSQFKCNVCNDISSTRRELRRHGAATKHQILREFLCATCTNSYFNQRKLDIHVVHLNLTNPPCKICGKLFGRKSSVRAHLATVQI